MRVMEREARAYRICWAAPGSPEIQIRCATRRPCVRGGAPQGRRGCDNPPVSFADSFVNVRLPPASG